MLIFIQEISLQLFLWLLQLIDGLMEIFSAISGVATVNYHGQQVNIIEFIVGDSTIGAVFGASLSRRWDLLVSSRSWGLSRI